MFRIRKKKRPELEKGKLYRIVDLGDMSAYINVKDRLINKIIRLTFVEVEHTRPYKGYVGCYATWAESFGFSTRDDTGELIVYSYNAGDNATFYQVKLEKV